MWFHENQEKKGGEKEKGFKKEGVVYKGWDYPWFIHSLTDFCHSANAPSRLTKS